ncbi:MAG: F0F1 ATP synthase subunit A, partial [Bdellovibrionales bacterium]|nr:F0F1 ATP synthase subunit A [Bdellovibrionales bacterium]
MKHHPFTFFQTYLPGVDHDNLHLISATFVVMLLIIGVFLVYPRMRQAKKNLIPSPSFGIRNIFEMLVEMLAQLSEDIIGHDSRKYLPFVGTIFFFMLFSNLLGLIPGFLPPTENWATGAAVATIVFITYNFFGFQAHGPAYFKHFIAPISLSGVKNVGLWILIMIPLVAFQLLFGTIELISNFLRPVTLSIRLF